MVRTALVIFFCSHQIYKENQMLTRTRAAPAHHLRSRQPTPWPHCARCSQSCRSATKNALAFPTLGVEGVRRQTDFGAREQRMLYLNYQTQSDMMAPVRAWASMALAAR